MKTTAWRKVFAISLGAALFAAGCVISSDDDDDDGTGGTGGSAGSAGTAGTGGTGGTAGTSGTGGTGGGHVYTCTEAVTPANECVTCLHQQCCGEFLACANDDTTTPCWGNSGEFFCIQGCITDLFNSRDAGGVSDEEKADCVGKCNKKGGTISSTTNKLFACVNSGDRADGGTSVGCAEECFGN